MISKYRHKELTWIDLESPSEEEILHVLEQYSIPLSIEEEIRLKTEESKTKLNSGFIFTSLYFPQISNSEDKIINNKIIFIINTNFILTIHNQKVYAFSEFIKNLEIDTTLPEQLQIKHTDLFSFYLIKSLYVNLKEQLSINESKINEIENKISKSYNKNIPELIFNMNKILIQVEQIIGSHDKILNTMSKFLIQIFGEKFENYSFIIIEEYAETKLVLESQNKNLTNLYNFNNLKTTNRNRKKLKLLTFLSISTFIIIILISLYVLNHI